MPEPEYLLKWRARADELRRILTTGFETSPVDEETYNPVQMVNNIWQKVLGQLVGYDYSASQPRLVAIDSQGRLVTATGGVPTITPNIAVVSVGVVATQIAQARAGRSYILLENASATDVWVNMTSTVVVNAGMLLQTGRVVELRDWVDELWGIVGVGSSNVVLVER